MKLGYSRANDRLLVKVGLKHLTDAGYNVLTYDFRNRGNSGAANNGVCGIGQWEWRDCVGVKKYVDKHPRLGKMKESLFSQCLGGPSQYATISKHPELFVPVFPLDLGRFKGFRGRATTKNILSRSVAKATRNEKPLEN